MNKNVVVAVFKVESEGYQALTELRQVPEGQVFLVPSAALVKKENGVCRLLDGFDTGLNTDDDTAIGGLIGMTVGILGGPIGMLLGMGVGSLVGANIDAGDAIMDTAMLEQIAGKLDNGMVALIAQVEENAEAELDSRLSKYDVVIARFDADVVEDEVARAAEMQEEMARQAKDELRKKKEEELKKISEENIRLINEEFHFDKKKEKAIEKREEKLEKAREITEENKKLIKDELDK